MIAVRGTLALAFGVAVLMWPDVNLATIVVLFGVYALLDGAWAILAAVRAVTAVRDAWPVLAEGGASVAFGVLALAWPRVPLALILVLATWGVATGVLQLIAAADASRSRPAHWVMITGGASSLFLALLLVLLPHADVDIIGRVIAACAQIFGLVLLLAALDFPRRRAEDAGVSSWV